MSSFSSNNSCNLPKLKMGAVHIWSQKLPLLPEQNKQLAALLSEDEMRHANAFYFAKDRERSIASHALLRLLLSHYTQIPAKQIPLTYNPYGKPQLVTSDLSFNLSHAENYLIYAFTGQNAIGIDIEKIKPSQDFELLLKSCLSPREYTEVQQLNPTAQLQIFYQLFTRKEAFLKALGVGLSTPLSEVELLFAPLATALTLYERTWEIYPIQIDPEYACHFVVEVTPQIQHIRTKMEAIISDEILNCLT